MFNKSIVVIGSCNTDMVIKTERFPIPGETVLGGTFFMNPGGKGANQAVAAKRLGGNVTFIWKTGNDIFGRQSEEMFREEGIDISYMISDSTKPSGVALITIDGNGENCIVVAPGSNSTLSPDDLNTALAAIKNAKLILMQLEIPLETALHVIAVAKKYGVKVILNPAPASKFPAEVFRNISIITPNQTELEMLTGLKVTDISSAKKAAKLLYEYGVQTVVVTLGEMGALLLHDNTFSLIKSPVVKALDTTAAGDVFNGALAVALSEEKSIQEAVSFACHAAAISVTRMGAQSSIPYRNEIILSKLEV